MPDIAGIDLNGLSDVAAFDTSATDVVGGAIPSVVVLQEHQLRGRPLTLIAGEEASRAIEGRGWAWPEGARGGDEQTCLRLPTSLVIDSLTSDRDVITKHGTIAAADIVAAAVESLARSRRLQRDWDTIVAIPDDGKFNEDVQQQLINSLSARGLKPTLLWRPIAALLGVAERLDPLASRLNGEEIGVISCLDSGLDVARFTVHAKSKDGQPYVVPERREPARHFPFARTIVEMGKSFANELMLPHGASGWQVMWGSGMVLRWLLGLESGPTIIQTDRGWSRIGGARPTNLPKVKIDEAVLRSIDELLSDVGYVIYEGPAVEAPAEGNRLVYFLRDRLAEGSFRNKHGRSRISLLIPGQSAHLTAKGCVEYQTRRLQNKITYLDHLPQIKLAVRRKDEPVFIPLISDGQTVEGGKPYVGTLELGISVPGGANKIEFYVVREGNLAPRFASVDLPRAASADIPVQMTVRQTPAQGRAQLTLTSLETDATIGSIDVNWDRMEVLVGETEEQILERLSFADLRIPPVQPHPYHALLWTYKPTNGDLSLAECIESFAGTDADEDSLIESIKAIRVRLTRFVSPFVLTRRHHPERTRSRAVSSEGEVPSDDLDGDLLHKFDQMLAQLNELMSRRGLSEELRSGIVLLGSWTFMRCPPAIRSHLRSLAEFGDIRNWQVDFNAMGRCFATEEEIRAYYSLMEGIARGGDGDLRYHHIYSLFNLLSLREDAPLYLSEAQARLFAKSIVGRLNEERNARRFGNTTRACIRSIAGLMRYRRKYRNFLHSETDPLGVATLQALTRLIDRTRATEHRAVHQLARSASEWLQERGTDQSILQWDDE